MTYSLEKVSTTLKMKCLCMISIMLTTITLLVACASPTTPTPPARIEPTSGSTTVPFMAVQLGGPTNTPILEGEIGRQIRFSVGDGKFTYLKIVGADQNGQLTTWEQRYQTGELFADTAGYQWKGTIVLTFDVEKIGRRACVIDYLHQPDSMTTVPVVYTEGRGCSGDAGSAASNRVLVEKLYKVLFAEEDTLRLFGELSRASDILQCTEAIIRGLESKLGIIKVGWECKGVAVDKVNEILKKYGSRVEGR